MVHSKAYNNQGKIAFLGWNHPAEKSFEILAKKYWIVVLVIPEQDNWRAKGIVELASRYKIPVETKIKNLKNYEYKILICNNYPKLVAEKYLKDKIAINCHWSLLPKYRGVHSTAWALINDDKKIGQSIHFMEKEFDTGDIISQSFVEVTDDMNIKDIFEELAEIEAKSLYNVINKYYSTGEITRFKQDHSQATYVPQRIPSHGKIDWTSNSRKIWNLIRALPVDLYPPAYSYLDHKKINIIEAQLIDSPKYDCIPGNVVRVLRNKGVWIKTGDKVLEINKVQMEGQQDIYTADKILKRGIQLGVNYEESFIALSKKVNLLEKSLNELKEKLENTD